MLWVRQLSIAFYFVVVKETVSFGPRPTCYVGSSHLDVNHC